MIRPNSNHGNGSNDPIYQRHNIRTLRDYYVVPSDPITRELELLTAFEERYKEDQERWSLSTILHSLSKVAGGVLGLKIIDAITPHSDNGEISIDDQGYFRGSEAGVMYSSIFLARMSETEYRTTMATAKTEAEKLMIEAQWKGYVLGEVPGHVNDAFDTVFQLIGAQKLRDDRDEGLPDGCILWRGEYSGRTVYLEQRYRVHSEYNGLPLLTASAMNEHVGKARITDLRGNDFDNFVSAGMTMQEIRDGEARGEIRHDNVDAIIALISQLQ